MLQMGFGKKRINLKKGGGDPSRQYAMKKMYSEIDFFLKEDIGKERDLTGLGARKEIWRCKIL